MSSGSVRSEQSGRPHTHALILGQASSSYVTPELDRSFQDLGKTSTSIWRNKLVSVSLHHVELATNGTRQHAARACEPVASLTNSANECAHITHCRTPLSMPPPAAQMLRRPAKVLNPIILGLQGRRICPKGSPPFQMKLVSAYIEQCSQPKETEIAEIAGSGSRLFQHRACGSRQAPVPHETGERPHRAMQPVKRLRPRGF